MSNPLKFELDVDDFEVIHRCINSTLMTSITVRVPKAALEALLRDHGMLLRLLQSGGLMALARETPCQHVGSAGRSEARTSPPRS